MGRSILLNGYVSRLKEVGFIQLGSVQSIFNCPFDIVFKKKNLRHYKGGKSSNFLNKVVD